MKTAGQQPSGGLEVTAGVAVACRALMDGGRDRARVVCRKINKTCRIGRPGWASGDAQWLGFPAVEHLFKLLSKILNCGFDR